MVPDDPDEASFAEEMARLGVKRLDTGRPAPARPGGQASGQRPGGQAPGQRPGGQAPGQRPGGDRSAGGGRPGRASAHPGPARAPAAARDTGAAASQELAATRQELAATRQELAATRQELAALREALAGAEAAQAAMEKERESQARHEESRAQESRDSERRRQDSERQGWERERAALREQARQLRERAHEAERAASDRRPLAEVLAARGCESLDEQVEVLRGLLSRRPRELVEAVELAAPERLARVLSERVVLAAPDLDADLGDSVVLHVSPERCEITGGSDIKAGFRRFLDACRQARARQITIVGGSPAYRRQLEGLAEPHRKELRLNLVSGTRRRTRKRADAELRTSDLVVIWGSTELDHSVSAVYTSGVGRTLQVNHRGISGMLSQVAEHLLGRRQG